MGAGVRHRSMENCLASKEWENSGSIRAESGKLFFGAKRPKGLRLGGHELVFEPFAREGPTPVHGSGVHGAQAGAELV
jgi:hypothetical protein